MTPDRVLLVRLSTLVFVASTGIACTNAQERIRLTSKAENIALVHQREKVPKGCIEVARIVAEDGAIGIDSYVEGTEERALVKLRNRAAQLGANLLWIDDSQFRTSTTVDHAKGINVKVGGTAFRCE